METVDDITPELRFLLLSLGFTGKEIDQLETLVPIKTEIHARRTARSFGGYVFGSPIKRRLPRSSKRLAEEPSVLIYTVRMAKDPATHEQVAIDPWWPLRKLVAKGDPLDLNLIAR